MTAKSDFSISLIIISSIRDHQSKSWSLFSSSYVSSQSDPRTRGTALSTLPFDHSTLAFRGRGRRYIRKQAEVPEEHLLDSRQNHRGHSSKL
jgi:hypothetical protein